MSRHRNDGIRKICECSRRQWAKCPHPWHFNFKWDGKAHRFSLDRHVGRRLTSKSEARKEADRLRTEIRAGRFGKTQSVAQVLTLAQLLGQYTERYLEMKRQASLRNDQYQIATIVRTLVELPTGELRAFGEWLVADISADALERFQASRMAKSLVVRTGPGTHQSGGLVTSNRNIALLRGMFNWAVRSRIIKETPFKYGTETVVRLHRELPRRRRLESSEAQALLQACAPRLRAIVEAALETGCRRGELLSLLWSQVRFTPRAEVVLMAAKTKTRRDRIVPISTRLRAVLELRRHAPDGTELPATALVFGDELGERAASIKTAWRLACQRAKLDDLHFHDLRREAGSRWLEGGVPLQTVKEWLGHTNIAQTSTYLASTLEGQHDAMQRFDARRAAALQPSATETGTGAHTLPQSAEDEDTKTQETIN